MGVDLSNNKESLDLLEFQAYRGKEIVWDGCGNTPVIDVLDASIQWKWTDVSVNMIDTFYLDLVYDLFDLELVLLSKQQIIFRKNLSGLLSTNSRTSPKYTLY